MVTLKFSLGRNFGPCDCNQGFSESLLLLNEWNESDNRYQCFFGPTTMGTHGFSMVAKHWSIDGMVTTHHRGLYGSEKEGD